MTIKGDHPGHTPHSEGLTEVWHPLGTPESQLGEDSVPAMCHGPDDLKSAACEWPAEGETPHSHLYHKVACARPLRGLIGIASSSLRFPEAKQYKPDQQSCEKANPSKRYVIEPVGTDLGMYTRRRNRTESKFKLRRNVNLNVHRVC